MTTEETIAALDRGELRVAEPEGDGWRVNPDAQAAILSNWEAASAHYNLIAIDSSPVSGHVVDPQSTVVFMPAGAGVGL